MSSRYFAGHPFADRLRNQVNSNAGVEDKVPSQRAIDSYGYGDESLVDVVKWNSYRIFRPDLLIEGRAGAGQTDEATQDDCAKAFGHGRDCFVALRRFASL